MFLGGLSTANEHEARKKKGGKKKLKDDELTADDTSNPSGMRRGKPGVKPILYSATLTSGGVPRDVILGFLRGCVEMMLDEHNLNEMINDSVRKNIGLHEGAVHFQRDVMEYNYQIEREFGCRYLALIPQNHPDDTELLEATKAFMFSALRSYVNNLHLRSRRYKSGSLQPPHPNMSMSRTTILEFLEGCNALMAMPETKKDLRQAAQATGEMPGPRIIELQRSLLPLLGYDPDFGVSCLNKIGTDFPNDRELVSKFQMYASCAEFAGIEAMMTEEERSEFYRTVPPMMYHFPHMHFMQLLMRKAQLEQQMQQERFNQAQQMSERGGDSDGRMDAEALRSSGMLQLLTSPEGRTKLQGLAQQIQESKARLEPVVSEWDLERKKLYFEGFKEHPLLAVLGKSADPGAKMLALTSMTPSEIDDLITLLVVISQEDGGDLLASLREQVAKESDSNGNSAVLNQVIKTMGSLAKMNKVGPAVSQPGASSSHTLAHHNHSSHGHAPAHGQAGHVHSAACSHGAPPRSAQPDISSGKAASMDR